MSSLDHLPLFKELSLYISGKVSGELKLSFEIVGIQILEKDYQSAQKDLPQNNFYGIFSAGKQGMLLSIDKNLLQLLTDKALGGSGVYEKKTVQELAPSELFIGKEFLDWILDFFQNKSIDLAFQRIEENGQDIHMFFPDQLIQIMHLTVKVAHHTVGMIQLIYSQNAFSHEVA